MPTDPLPQQLQGASLVAVIAAIGAAVNEFIKRRKKPATLQEKAADALKALSDDALTKAETAKVISDAFNGLLDNLQRQARIDRHRMNNMEASIQGLTRRLDETTAAAERALLRSDRNKRTLLEHIDALCKIMRGAGMDTPPLPSLEGEALPHAPAA